ncbi:MAG: FAD-dependent thymidylate synthase [Bacilli bacterium]|nr:FAD-dependent thymidylate synthase [Bacilli bacterium]
MNETKINMNILPNMFLKENGTFNLEEALKFSGYIAGVCYDEEGYEHIKNEPEETTQRRIKKTLVNKHHSVYDHITINFDINNIPKILAMVINNEHQYTTAEKSARFTAVDSNNDIITATEEEVYNKWVEIFKNKITNEYNGIPNRKLKTLCQENARYLVTVFMPTKMIYSTTFRQINYLASWMNEYIKNASTPFEVKLAGYMQEFVDELKSKNVLEPRLMENEKNRKLTLFGTDLKNKQQYYRSTYSTLYKSSYAALAQAQRHRTLNYEMEMLDNKEIYIPPFLMDNKNLMNEWLNDYEKVKDLYPQGELVLVHEVGTFENFILKCKERLCSEAQLEIMNQTRDTMMKYRDYTEAEHNPLYQELEKYSHGARCTFPDYKCSNDCHNLEGKKLTRRI